MKEEQAATIRPECTCDNPILLVDDEKNWLDMLTISLEAYGFTNVSSCLHPKRALKLLAQQPFDIAFLDIHMPVMQGDELLRVIRNDYPQTAVFMLSALNDVEKAVECMRIGAENYLVKPVHISQLVGMITKTLKLKALQKQNESLRNRLLHEELETPDAFSEIITTDRGMQLLFSYIEIVAGTLEPVLITGETGVGKELVARAVHRCSGRSGEFVAVNVAGFDDTTFSDTLFGHKRGAFTGATDDRKGLVEQARGGTLFLDEMGSLDPRSQVKLLRLIQEGEYMPLGVDTPRKAEIRLVAATNKNLKVLQTEGAFRKDLYYRLNTHHVYVPPLRERSHDIPVLVQTFLALAADKYDKAPAVLPDKGLCLLQRHAFPGNVRELRALMMDAGARYAGVQIPLAYLQEILGVDAQSAESVSCATSCTEMLSSLSTLPTLQEVQQVLIQEALDRTDGNQSAAANLLGITRQALNQRLKSTKKSSR